MGDRLYSLHREVMLAYGAAENLGTETYTSGNRTTILSNLDSARDALLVAGNANASGSNP
jgi:hypothetical protein